jgi:integrase
VTFDDFLRGGASTTSRIFDGDQMTPDNVSHASASVCRLAGILDFNFHDLRHTAASWMRISGADIHTVALVLGHKDLRMGALPASLTSVSPMP